MKNRALRHALVPLLTLAVASTANAGAILPPHAQPVTRGQHTRQVLRKCGTGLAIAAHVAAPFVAYYISKHTGSHEWAGYVSVDPRDIAAATMTGVASVISAVALWGGNLPAHPSSPADSNGIGYRFDQHGHFDITYGNQGLGGVTQSLSHPGHVTMNLGGNQVIDLLGSNDN